ncbi:MAG: radical SAM protein [Oscillospiraceae bacterium]|nr:radical SAM protein [Oscillospiraceae bacterium]
MRDESGIIFDIDHFAVHDGPGIRTVIYLKGCPLRCVWCHSPESQAKEPQPLHINEKQTICGRTVKASEVVGEVIEDKVFFDSSGGGVTLSGGEVLFQPEFAEALLAQFHDGGIYAVVETSGMGKWENLRSIAKYTDIFYYDVKTLDNEKHIIYTGAGNKIILDNLKKLAEYMPEKIVLRVPLIPGYNDSESEITEIYVLARELCIYSIHLLRYNTSAPAKYQWLDLPYQLGELKRQSNDYVEKLREIAPKGINVTVF